MAASISSSCCVFIASSNPLQTHLLSSVHHPSKTLILWPIPSFLRTIVTFQKIIPPISSSSPSPSNSVSLQPIEELPPNLQDIVKLFQSVQEPKAKYEQLLFYGKNLKPLESRFKTRENKVEGCVSQVWIRAFFDEEGRNVVYEADSDSVLTKGLAALLVNGLSGRPVTEILRVTLDFAVLLGLQQSLTPSRNNGFLNMLRLMQKKALSLEVVKGEDEIIVLEADSEPKTSVTEVEDSERNSKVVALGSRGVRIRERLEKELNPVVELEVEDVSHQHSGHAAVRGGSADGETHFNLRLVSDASFKGKSLVKRHRMVYDLLQEELQSGLHALSIVAKTPSEV